MLTPSIGFCGTPLSTAGILQSGRFEDGRRDVDDMVELRADAALVSDARGPGDDHAVASTAEVRGNLLGPLERRVHRMGPTDRVVIERRWATEFIHAAHDFVEIFRNGVEKGHLVEQALWSAFGARAVISLDVDDKRVVEFALVRKRIDDATHLGVAIAQRGRIDLHHVGCDFLVVGVERIPRGNARGALGQLGILRHYTQPLLASKRFLADLIPALIELALEFGDPILWRMVRGVRRAWSEIGDPWLVRRNRMEQANPFDGLVCHVLVEEIVFDIVWRLDRLDVLENGRGPLAGVPADKSIKIFKSQSRRSEE